MTISADSDARISPASSRGFFFLSYHNNQYAVDDVYPEAAQEQVLLHFDCKKAAYFVSTALLYPAH